MNDSPRYCFELGVKSVKLSFCLWFTVGEFYATIRYIISSGQKKISRLVPYALVSLSCLLACKRLWLKLRISSENVVELLLSTVCLPCILQVE